MDSNNKNDKTQQENLQMVLRDLVHEQQLNTKSLNDLVSAFNILSKKINILEETKPTKNEEPQPSTPPILNDLKKDLTFIKLAVSAKPQNITKKWQILLFPEQDAKLFYKIILRFGILFLSIVLLINNTFSYLKYIERNRNETKLMKLNNDKIRQAWKIMYQEGKKNVKQTMDSAFSRAVRD